MSTGPDSPRSFSMSSSVPSRNAFSLLPPEELLPYVVPFNGGPGLLAGVWVWIHFYFCIYTW